MFENKKNSLLPFSLFIKRVLKYFFYTLIIIGFSLLTGTLGYHYIARLAWINSFYNGSMILTGMGPVDVMINNSAKLFSSFYALFSGVAFLSTIAVLFAPIAHRFLHTFHLEENNSK